MEREIEDKGSECGSSGLAYILNRNVVNSDWRFNMCGSDVKSVTAGLHPAPGTIRHGLLMTRLLHEDPQDLEIGEVGHLK